MNRAQSETIGFILVFSMIVASTGIVYVTGFSSLQDVRDAEQLDNMERAFDVLDDNLRDVTRRGAPTRATELSLGGGGLYLGDATRLTVTATNTSNASDNVSATLDTRPIIYEHDDSKVVYTSGAIVRDERGGAVMVSEPKWLIDHERTVVPLLDVSADGDRTAVGGQTEILMRVGLDSRGVIPFETGPGASANLTVTVESPRAVVWKRFMEDRGFTAVDPDPSDGEVTYRITVDDVYLHLTFVGVEFDR